MLLLKIWSDLKVQSLKHTVITFLTVECKVKASSVTLNTASPDMGKKKKKICITSEAMTIKHQKDNFRLKISLHLLPCLTLKDRDSGQYTDSSFSIPPPQVVWSARRGSRSRHKLYLVLFGFVLCCCISSYLKFQMQALKTQIFYSLVWLWNM